MKTIQLLMILGLVYMTPAMSQNTDANIFGDVQSAGNHVPFINVYIEGTTVGTSTDETGHYMMVHLPVGNHVLVAKGLGFEPSRVPVEVIAGKTVEVNFELKETIMSLNEVVVTGTKTFKRRTESPVIVNVIDSRALEAVQACNLSDGLRFQPGLRVETDCQTCNYTQLRMNGLQGGYSQILVNGRPVFSPLTGLYGMEQIPANMIERIEVVRGGGSALYGSSAIGGTVNIITRIPRANNYDFNLTMQDINGGATDAILNGNVNVLNRQRNAGAAVFVNRRQRAAYDHDGDNFSELPELRNNAFGATLFYKPGADDKLELNVNSLTEYRYGGELIQGAAHQALQSEERIHHVLMGGLDYRRDFNGERSSFSVYLGGQHTDRDHYTGIFPDSAAEKIAFLQDPPYGVTANTTLQAGLQVNHKLKKFFTGQNVLTFGAEHVYDDILDVIPAYHYQTDQTTHNSGVFLQSDWMVNPRVNLLSGVRVDRHNLLGRPLASPRVSLLYTPFRGTQLRATWGTGFRAPQAFDADMHLAFAGGGVSRIRLDDDLREERSESISGSVNYDKATEQYIAGFTLEAFYTGLSHAFYLEPVGTDVFGDVFEKRNGPGATVQGVTLEIRANYNRKTQVEAGYTWQKSLYEQPVLYIAGQAPTRHFLKTPGDYGYVSWSYMPGTRFTGSLNLVHTGPMLMAHFAGAPEQAEDAFYTSGNFTEMSVKLAYVIPVKEADTGVELFAGVKNLTNAYQRNFDTGKNRDSNFIYGPGTPRTIYVGLRLKSYK